MTVFSSIVWWVIRKIFACRSISLILIGFLMTEHITPLLTKRWLIHTNESWCALTHFREDVYARQLRRMGTSSLMQLTHISRCILCVYFGLLSSGLLCTVWFKSKLTVRCESRFLTRFTSLNSCMNQESRTSYQELSRRSSLTGQKTKDSPMTDFSIILQRHTDVTQNGMVIFVQETVCLQKDQFML